MSVLLADRTQETTLTAGTGTITRAGAVAGFQSFDAGIGDTNTCYYEIGPDATGQWEVGKGTVHTAAGTLTRDSVLTSSNANALVNFAAGPKSVFVSIPSSKILYSEMPAATVLADADSLAVVTAAGNKLITFANLTTNLGSGTGGLRLGPGAGSGLTTGNNVTAIGVNSASGIQTGSNNLVVTDGTTCALRPSATQNAVLATNASFGALTGDNTLSSIAAVGSVLFSSATTAAISLAVAAGASVFSAVTTGTLTRVVGIGSSVFGSVTTGTLTDAIAIGHASGVNVTGGDHNVFIGRHTGIDVAGSASFRTALGSGATCTADNQVVLGTSSETVVHPGPTTLSGTVTITDAINVVLGTTTGTQLGTATTQKLGLFGATPLANAVAMTATTVLNWNGALGLAESAAGVLELNNGTQGTPASAPGITVPNPSSGATPNFTFTCASAAAASGNNGGNFIIIPGLHNGGGSDGYFAVQQPGGTKQLRMYDDGTNGYLYTASGAVVVGNFQNVIISAASDGSAQECEFYSSGGITQRSGYFYGWGITSNPSCSLTGSTATNTITAKNNLALIGTITNYNNVNTAGLGVPAVYGLDNRTGLTGVDGAAITLYTSTAANQIYRVSCDIFATAAVAGTWTYTISWTEHATTQTISVTATAINVLGTTSAIIRPDNATTITAQLTSTGGATGTLTVLGCVEQLA